MTGSSPPSTLSVDLTNCDREPIHVPGAVQPHGVLLALREPDLVVVMASANAPEMLGAPSGRIPGAHVGALLDEASVLELEQALREPDPRAASPLRLRARDTTADHRGFDGIVHRSTGLVVLELEPVTSEREVAFADVYPRVRAAFTRLQRAGRVPELCDVAAAEVFALTGFDRVMAYTFDRDDHGHVIAEHRREGLDSFLDLHYPASDVPAQARRLYTLNWLRLIADVRYQPSSLIPPTTPSGEPLDLSFAVLRSVSPIHQEYLRNMGVLASMSVSLVVDGRLWGMLICHHYAPRFVPYEVRAACEWLGQALSWQLAARERADAFEHRASVTTALSELVAQMAKTPDLHGALAERPDALLSLASASGAAVRFGGRWSRVGEAPSETTLNALVEPIGGLLVDGVFATDRLSRAGVVPTDPELDAVASGVLAVGVGPDHGDLVVWFRPEVVQTVNWAGDPRKLADAAGPHERLTPRGSFALWRETVRGVAIPWQPWEVEAAADLRRAIVGHVLRRNEELARLIDDLKKTTAALAESRDVLESRVAERTAALTQARDALAKYADDLARSNVELERFAYIASHDLQEPLRMVVSYVQLLARRYQGKLDGDADEFIAFAVDGAKRMQALINDLLAYSRVGRQDRPMAPVDLEATFKNVRDNLSLAIRECGAEVTHDPLPTVTGDALELGQVLQNLVGNALKFRDDRVPRVHVSARHDEQGWTISVRDHGIGIAPAHIGRIFVVFQRLHTRAEYPGSGVGLAISKKIVERHGGRIWVESTKGEGSTFYFTLPDRTKTEVSP